MRKGLYIGVLHSTVIFKLKISFSNLVVLNRVYMETENWISLNWIDSKIILFKNVETGGIYCKQDLDIRHF